MVEPIKVPEEDLKKVAEIQAQYQTKITEFGNLYLEKMGIDEAIKIISDRETQIQADWKEIQKKESAFIEDLLKRYGEGNLDLKAGVFVPSSTN